MGNQLPMDKSSPQNDRDGTDLQRRILIIEDNGDMRDFLRPCSRATDMHTSKLPMGSRGWRLPIATILT